MKHFFITGAPRMRSAWLANFLTYGSTFCHHDIFSYVDTMEEFHREMRRDHYDVMGVSDPALAFYWKDISAAYPDAPWIVIERPFMETLESCRKAFPGFDEFMLRVIKKSILVRLKNNLKPHLFDFHDLRESELQRIARICDTNIPHDRVSMLMKMQIQIEPKYLLTKIQELKNYPTPLMKDLNASILA